MIENEKQYGITKAWAEQFLEALRSLDNVPDGEMHPIQHKAHKDAVSSQYEELRAQMREWEKKRTEEKKRSFKVGDKVWVPDGEHEGTIIKLEGYIIYVKNKDDNGFLVTYIDNSIVPKFQYRRFALDAFIRGKILDLQYPDWGEPLYFDKALKQWAYPTQLGNIGEDRLDDFTELRAEFANSEYADTANLEEWLLAELTQARSERDLYLQTVREFAEQEEEQSK